MPKTEVDIQREEKSMKAREVALKRSWELVSNLFSKTLKLFWKESDLKEKLV